MIRHACSENRLDARNTRAFFLVILEVGEAGGLPLLARVSPGGSYTLAVDERRGTLRSFLIGGLLGGAAGLAASGRMKVRRRPQRTTLQGLAAFEQAPCYRELGDRETTDVGTARR